MAGDGKIGGAFFTLSVNSGEFDTQMKQAATSAKSASDQVEGSVLKQVSSFRTLFSQVAGGVATFAAFFAAGQRIGKMFAELTAANEEFIKSIQGGAPEARLAAIAKEMEGLQNAMAGGVGGTLDALWGGMTPAQVRARVEALERERTAVQLIADGRRAEAEDKAADAKYKKELAAWVANENKKKELARQLGDELDQLRLDSAGSEFERIRTEADIAIGKAREKFGDYEGDSFGKLIDAIAERRERRLREANAKIFDEQMKAEKELADERLKLEMSNIRRLEDYRRSLTQGFGVGDVASSDLSALVDAMKQVTANQISSRD
jgi:hypothetical protein